MGIMQQVQSCAMDINGGFYELERKRWCMAGVKETFLEKFLLHQPFYFEAHFFVILIQYTTLNKRQEIINIAISS